MERMNQSTSCPVCRTTHGITLDDRALSVYTCSACGHMFTVLPKREQYTYEPDYFSREHENWFLHPDLKLFQSISDHISAYAHNRPVSVLDVGCGDGALLRFLLPRQPQASLYGIDVAENKDSKITFVRGDFETYQFSKRFDFIAGLMVAEHVEDPIVMVKKIYEVAERGAPVFFTTINSGSLLYTLARLFKKFGWRTPYERLYQHHHLQHYTNRSLRKAFEDNGFEVVSQKNHNFPIAAMDVPQGSRLMEIVYRTAVIVLFGISWVFGWGICQTIIARKKER